MKDLADVHDRAGAARTELRSGLRGSSLLVVGRVLSVGVNFGTQVLIVRSLTKADFGAFAWGLAVVAMGSTLGLLGTQKALARFVPMHRERGDGAAETGTVLLALASTAGVGLCLAAAALGLSVLLRSEVVSDPLAVQLMLILVGLVPIQGLDNVFHSVASIYASPRDIFVRRHVVAPLLRLGSAAYVAAAGAPVQHLAWAYLVTGAVGVAWYGASLMRRLVALGVLTRERVRAAPLPFREIYGFGLPQLTTDGVWIIRTGVSVVVLETFAGPDPVAELRAVVPLAGLCLVVLESTRFLYLPLASRFVARDDPDELHRAYSAFSAWTTVLSFPVFAACLAFSSELAVLLFGADYATAGPLLQVLAIGNFVDAVTGANALTLSAFGHVRILATVNLAVAAAALALLYGLIPVFGALGAAWAVALTVVLQNVLNQTALVRRTGVGRLAGGHAPLAGCALAAGIGLAALNALGAHPLVTAATLVVAWAALFRVGGRLLAVAETFPELAKLDPRKRFGI